MDRRILDRAWRTRLQPWLRSREEERRRLALRFYATALPGVAIGIAVAWLSLGYTEHPVISGVLGILPALALSWIGWSPLQRLQEELRTQFLSVLADAFDLEHQAHPPADFDLQRFHELDLVYSSPGELEDTFSGNRSGCAFEAVEANLCYPRPPSDRDIVGPRFQDFSGILVRIRINRRPASDVILTREAEWFAKLAEGGACFSAGRLALFDWPHPGEDQAVKVFAESRETIGAVVTPGLLDGLKALQPAFRSRALRLAIVPEENGGTCYVAGEALGFAEAGSILEPLDRRARFDAWVAQVAAINSLVDLIAREVDSAEVPAEGDDVDAD